MFPYFVLEYNYPGSSETISQVKKNKRKNEKRGKLIKRGEWNFHSNAHTGDSHFTIGWLGYVRESKRCAVIMPLKLSEYNNVEMFIGFGIGRTYAFCVFKLL